MEVASVDNTFKKFGFGRKERERTVLARNVKVKSTLGFGGVFLVLFKFFIVENVLTCIK